MSTGAGVLGGDDKGEARRSLGLFLWAAVAAFGTYFCMYGVRMPFKVATYSEVEPLWGGVGFKAVLLTSQVLGYTISKFVGIGVIAAMRPERRAVVLITLVLAAELALVGFAIVPTPWNAVMLFFNGLPLGMVFGLVMGFLEGRRQSEAMLAGLCASFIAADGVTKGVGAWVMTQGVSTFWMPAVTGAMFFVPMLAFVWALTKIPQPDARDVEARSAREAMGAVDRWALFRKYAPGLSLLMGGYLLITVLRSVRGDFAPEIWKGLGVTAAPSTFAMSEVWVALLTLGVFGGLVFVTNNRRAFGLSVVLSVLGFAVGVAALVGIKAGWVSPFVFMVLIGVGLYLPYMAVHTTLFERLLAVTRDKGNIGYLMYLVDSFGYLGYVAMMFAKGFVGQGGRETVMLFFEGTAWVTMVGGMLAFTLAGVYFTRHAAWKRVKTTEVGHAVG